MASPGAAPAGGGGCVRLSARCGARSRCRSGCRRPRSTIARPGWLGSTWVTLADLFADLHTADAGGNHGSSASQSGTRCERRFMIRSARPWWRRDRRAIVTRGVFPEKRGGHGGVVDDAARPVAIAARMVSAESRPMSLQQAAGIGVPVDRSTMPCWDMVFPFLRRIGDRIPSARQEGRDGLSPIPGDLVALRKPPRPSRDELPDPNLAPE